jgi:hypothetical protein
MPHTSTYRRVHGYRGSKTGSEPAPEGYKKLPYFRPYDAALMQQLKKEYGLLWRHNDEPKKKGWYCIEHTYDEVLAKLPKSQWVDISRDAADLLIENGFKSVLDWKRVINRDAINNPKVEAILKSISK